MYGDNQDIPTLLMGGGDTQTCNGGTPSSFCGVGCTRCGPRGRIEFRDNDSLNSPLSLGLFQYDGNTSTTTRWSPSAAVTGWAPRTVTWASKVLWPVRRS